MVTWKEFAAAAPDLAGLGQAQLNQFSVGLAFLATIRLDGAPRLHPVCPVISDDRLFVLVTAASPKRRDLLRDGRYALQTFPQPKPHGGRIRDGVRAPDRSRHAHAMGERADPADATGAAEVAGAVTGQGEP